MSSMDNHRRRSRRGNQKRKVAFGSMARAAWIRPVSKARPGKLLGLGDMRKLMSRRGRHDQVRVPAEAKGTEL